MITPPRMLAPIELASQLSELLETERLPNVDDVSRTVRRPANFPLANVAIEGQHDSSAVDTNGPKTSQLVWVRGRPIVVRQRKMLVSSHLSSDSVGEQSGSGGQRFGDNGHAAAEAIREAIRQIGAPP